MKVKGHRIYEDVEEIEFVNWQGELVRGMLRKRTEYLCPLCGDAVAIREDLSLFCCGNNWEFPKSDNKL